jgi:hypothetical protein
MKRPAQSEAKRQDAESGKPPAARLSS